MARAAKSYVPEFDMRDRLQKAAHEEARRRGLGSIEALVAELIPVLGVSRNSVYKRLNAAIPRNRYWAALSELARELHTPIEWLATGETWEPDDPRRDRIRELAELEGMDDPLLLTLGAASPKVAVARRRSADQGKRRTPWPVLSAGHAA